MRASILPPSHWEAPYKLNRTRKITSQEFDGYKRAITQLYISENLELDEVRRIMAQRYKFYGSEPQYKKRLRLWRLEKYIPKRKVVHLLRKSDQRQAQGKRTECIFHSPVISIEGLDRSRQRYREDIAVEPPSPAVSTLSDAESRTPCSDSTLTPTTIPSTPAATGTVEGAFVENSSQSEDIQPIQLPTPPPQPQDFRPPKALLDEVVELLDEKRYGNALDCLNTALVDLGNADDEQHQNWDPHMTDAIGNMGLAYSEQGHYAKAQDYTERALARFEKSGNHRSTAGALNNLGIVFDKQGDYSKALESHERALAGFQKISTSNDTDPDMINTLNNMGIVFRKQGNHTKALEYHFRALDGSRKAGNHLGCAISLNNIGVVFFSQGNFNGAWEYYSNSLTCYESTIFGDNPDMLATLHNVGLLFEASRLYAQALPYYQRALAGYGNIYGDNSHVTLGTLRNLGNVLYNLRDYEKTIDICARELAARKKVLGRKHDQTIETQCRLTEAKAALSRQREGSSESDKKMVEAL